jgi:hypothetical protein
LIQDRMLTIRNAEIVNAANQLISRWARKGSRKKNASTEIKTYIRGQTERSFLTSRNM